MSTEIVWICNECNSGEYSESVSEEDIQKLQCSNCGCNEFHKGEQEIIGTTGEIVDLFNKELSQKEWNALAIIHRLTARLSVGIRFDWSKSIDVRSQTSSQIIDESVFFNKEKNEI